MKNISIEKFLKQFKKEYNFLYDNNDRVAGRDEAIDTFDEMLKTQEWFKEFVREFCRYRGDIVSSDRECAAFMFALEVLDNE